jgi:phage shock protein C
MQPGDQAFYRGSDRIVGGVCSGLAAGFHVDPVWVRIAFVLLAFVQGIGVFIYIVLWLVMPERIDGGQPRSGFDSMAADLRRVREEVQSQFGGILGPKAAPSASDPAGTPPDPAVVSRPRAGQSIVLGLVLLLLGISLLAANTGLVTWGEMWPAALIIVGVVLLIRTLDRRR